MSTGAALVGENDHDAVAAAQRRRGQAQLPALRHPQISQPQDPGFQEGQGQGKISIGFEPYSAFVTPNNTIWFNDQSMKPSMDPIVVF